MASNSGPDMASMLLNRYRVEATLGEGGFGTVVRAFDTRLKRTVAIKTLKRSLATDDIEQFRAIEERFAREAEAGSRMGIHTNLVTVHDLVIEPDRTQYLILEYVRGGTLAERLAHGALPFGDALRVTADVARGLQSAHDVGIVHRDVKPANIFLTPDGRAQLGDFGIAQIDDVSGRTHAVVRHPGTPLYMSPEQAQTTGYVRPASDQYSLGLVLFEALTGKAYKRIGERAASALLEAYPALVVSLVEDMIATNPDDRLPSCDQVARRIATIIRQAGQEETRLPEPPVQVKERGASRPPGVPSDDGQALPTSGVVVPPDAALTALGVTEGTRRRMAHDDRIVPLVTTGKDAQQPPLPLDGGRVAVTPSGRVHRGIAIGAGVALVLLMVIGVGATMLLRGAGRGTQVTQTPQQPAPATFVAAAILPTASVAPTTSPTALPSVVPQPTATPMPAPTATAIATATVMPPTAVPTVATPTSVPVSVIAVYSVGTTNANLETVNGDDVVVAFTTGQEVYGWINFGGAQVNRDVLEAIVVADGTPQPPQSFTLTKSDGFLVFPLGRLGAGNYRLEVRYANKIAQTADFQVAAPLPILPRQPTPIPRVTTGGSTNPSNPVLPTAVPPPVANPTAVPVAPRPTVYIPPTQPPPKP